MSDGYRELLGSRCSIDQSEDDGAQYLNSSLLFREENGATFLQNLEVLHDSLHAT